MSAIITNNFRRNSCKSFVDQITSSNDYFIGIGKSDKWPDSSNYSEDNQLFEVPLPNGTIIENQDVLDNLISLVRVKDTEVLVPRNSWESGRKYKVYDPYDPLSFDYEGDMHPCYITVNECIYVCLDNNTLGFSTVPPGTNYVNFKYEPDADTGAIHVLETTDGYTWAFLQQNSVGSNFYTEQFIPIAEDTQTPDNAKLATGGLIYNFKIVAGGTNLTGSENIILKGVDENGENIEQINLQTDVRFVVNYASGTSIVSSIKYTELNNLPGISTTNALMGYSKASIEVYNSYNDLLEDVRIQPLIAPIGGFGARPSRDLPSYYAGCYSRFSGSVDGEALVDTPMRQISLIKDPQRNTTGVTAGETPVGIQYTDEEALDAVDYIQCDANTLTRSFTAGSIITQGDVRVYVDFIDMVNDRIFYHTNSNYNVNYVPLTADQSITITPLNGDSDEVIDASSIDSVVTSEYIHNTGDVVFIDHRKKIVRNSDQTEDIKIVIQF
jgi:hypothetical protein